MFSKNIIRLFFLILSVCSLNSCRVFTGTNSIKEEKVISHEKIKKLSIYISSSFDNSYNKVFSNQLHKQFLQEGIESMIYLDDTKKKMNLSAKKFIEEVEEYNPSHILKFQLIKDKFVESKYGQTYELEYSVELIDRKNDALEWSGTIYLDAGFTKNILVKRATSDLIKILKDNKII